MHELSCIFLTFIFGFLLVSARSQECGKIYAPYCKVEICTFQTIHMNCDDKKRWLRLKVEQGVAEINCDNTDIVDTWLKNSLLQNHLIQSLHFNLCPMQNLSLYDFLNTYQITQVTKISLRNIPSNSISKHLLQNLHNITHLYMPSNKLTELPERIFQDMINLQNLDLSFNNLTVFHNELQNLHKLRKLELGANDIHTLSSNVFLNLSEIVFLNLWDNNLSSLNRSMFLHLTKIESLDVSVNEISFISPDTFADMKNLTTINLSKNKFSDLPQTLFTSNQKLQYIKLSINSHLSNLPSKLFAHLPFLQNVIMDYCNISVLPEDIFWESNNIVHLSIHHNSIVSLPPLIFKHSVMLQYLDISHNKLATLPDIIFLHLNKLQNLHLNHNNLTKLNGQIFQSFQNLQSLNLQNNQLEYIHAHAFQAMKELQEMQLAYNRLSFNNEFGILWSPIQYCMKLKVLDLSHNNISEIFEDWVMSLLHLKELNLSYNNIYRVQSEDLQFSSKDRLIVNLEYNNISTINLEYLEIMALQNAGSADETYPINVKLKENPLYCDCITYKVLIYLEKKMKSQVYNMIDLQLDNLVCVGPDEVAGIHIAELSSDSFSCPLNILKYSSKCKSYLLQKHRYIEINCTKADLQTIPDLTFLHDTDFPIHVLLDHNNIKSLPAQLRREFNNVTKLSLSYNAISHLNSSSLHQLNLELLRLDHNNLTTISPSILQMWTNRTNVTLHNNPWVCDCINSTLELYNFLKGSYKQVDFLGNITCHDGRVLAHLTYNDICPFVNVVIIAASIIVAVVGILIGLLAALYFRFQSAIKIWLYAHNMCLWFATEEELDKDKHYDAFISYSHHDEDFVTNNLLPELETGTPSFKLCIHFRDWIAGEFITTQIAQSVEDSRRTIIVLSENFIKSEWGRLEFRAAHKQALAEGRTRVIIIIYGNISSFENLDTELQTYLKTNTYVKWGDPWFWDKLKYALPHYTKKTKQKVKYTDKSELIQSTSTITSTPPADIATNPLELKLQYKGYKTSHELQIL